MLKISEMVGCILDVTWDVLSPSVNKLAYLVGVMCEAVSPSVIVVEFISTSDFLLSAKTLKSKYRGYNVIGFNGHYFCVCDFCMMLQCVSWAPIIFQNRFTAVFSSKQW